MNEDDWFYKLDKSVPMQKLRRSKITSLVSGFIGTEA